MPAKTQLQQAIEKAAQDFAVEILQAIRNATLDEIASLSDAPPAPAKEAAAPEAAPVAAKKPRKKRSWPTCSVDGCGKNVYMPSGAKKMCYAHHMEAGGKPSPLVNARKKKAADAAKPAPKAAKKPAAKAPEAKVEQAAPAPEVKKPRKKRTWPTCTVKGCTKNVYMPSGANKMCYAHHIEAGGKESPLAATNKKRKAAAAKAAKAAKRKAAPPKKKAAVRKAAPPKKKTAARKAAPPKKTAAAPKKKAAPPKKKAVVRKAGQASIKDSKKK